MTFRMIQPMGKKPVTAPSAAARRASPAGMVKPKIATAMATTSAITAATCAWKRPEAMSPSRITTGIAATSVDSNSLASGS